MRSQSPEGLLLAKICIGCFAFSLLIIIFRIVYYRNQRDYFSEEMDHRRSLAKGTKS